MKKTGIYITIFLIIIAGLFLVLGILNANKSTSQESFNQENNKQESNKDNIQDSESDKNILERIIDFLDIGGGSDSDGDSSQDSNQELEQISYSIRNFEQTSLCNEYQAENCIDKSSSCSLTAENLDNQVTGIFEIKFTFFNNLNDELFSESISYSISPGNNQTFKSNFNIQGQEANQDVRNS
jgi:hypothetical protein